MKNTSIFAVIAMTILVGIICAIELYFVPKATVPHDYVEKTTIMNSCDTSITIHEIHYL